MELFCKQPSKKLFLCLPFKMQNDIYLVVKNEKSIKPLYEKIMKWYEYPIQRYVNKITEQEQKKIMKDLGNDIKKDHWMWWTFPQPKGIWGKNIVSKNTIYYSLDSKEELIRFLNIFSSFYKKIIKKLLLKNNISLYFGYVDTLKLKSHLIFCRSVEINSDVKRLQEKLLNKINQDQ